MMVKVEKATPGEIAKLSFNLKSHPLAAMTEIQTSESDSFAKIESIKIQDSTTLYTPAKSGLLFARARSLNAKGWPISRFAETQAIAVPQIKRVVEVRKLASVSPAEKSSALKLDNSDDYKVLRIPKVSVWGGAGSDFLQFNQSSTNELTSGTFSKLMAPAIMFGLGFKVGDKSTVNLQYHDAPGSVNAKSDDDVTTTTYHWRSAIAEWQYEILNRGRVRYNALFGGQVHQIPFLYVDGGGTVSVLQNELSNLSVGFRADYMNSSGYVYEAFLRYQYLVGARSLTGDDFKASSQLMFDGSAGVTKLYSNGMKIGAFWFGQSQNLRYNFSKDGTKSSGNQSFFGSTFQFRFGYEFF